MGLKNICESDFQRIYWQFLTPKATRFSNLETRYSYDNQTLLTITVSSRSECSGISLLDTVTHMMRRYFRTPVCKRLVAFSEGPRKPTQQICSHVKPWKSLITKNCSQITVWVLYWSIYSIIVMFDQLFSNLLTMNVYRLQSFHFEMSKFVNFWGVSLQRPTFCKRLCLTNYVTIQLLSHSQK